MIKTYVNLLFKRYQPNVLSQKIKHIFKDEFKFKKLKSATFFLQDNATISERVYYIHNDLYKEKTCRNCNNSVEFKSLFHGHKSFCSKICRDTYGMGRVVKEWWLGLDENKQQEYIIHYKKSYKKSFKEQYGVEVDNPSMVPEIRRRAEDTCLERYGNRIPSKLDEMKERSKKTCLERYGVENSMLDPKLREKCLKNNYKHKKYHFSDTDIVITQGYTPHLLDLFKKNKIDRNLFKVEYECVAFEYFYNNKKRFYHPDVIYKDIVIEVKSDYTLLNEKDFDVNILKATAVIEKGLSFIFLVYDFRKNIHHLINLFNGVNDLENTTIFDIFLEDFIIYHFDITNNIKNDIIDIFKEN